MKHYTLTIKPTSPFMTPIESDTLFGHMCWAMEYLNIFTGNKSLKVFLEQFDSPEPPLIISSGFPEGFLPIPLLPPLSEEEKKQLQDHFIEKKQNETVNIGKRTLKLQFIQCLKQYSRKKYISIETFEQFKSPISKYQLYLSMLDKKFPQYPLESHTIEVNHNAIDRISSQVIEGRFFSQSTTFYPKEMKLSVYLKTNFFSQEELEAIFKFIAINGFGGDKTTGNGKFDFQLTPSIPFIPLQDFNAYILLSNTNPSILKQYDSVYYSARTKFGKIGGEYSISSPYSPLKNPLILIEPGTIVKTDRGIEYFGENFRNIHPQLPHIIHYGIGFPIKMRLKNEE